jgi:multiple sugar transport system substrate-binding protein
VSAAATAACGLLTACSSAGGASGSSQSATAAPATTGNAIELTQWYHQYGEDGTQDAALRYAASYSNVQPNVKVTVSWTPGDYGSKLSSGLLGSQPPDVFEQSALGVDMVRAGQVAPVDDLFGDAKSDFDQTGLNANMVDGKLYGVNMIYDTGVIYYRKSVAGNAGVSPPMTLDDLGAAIDKMTSKRVKGIFLGNDGGIGVLADEVLWSSGHNHLKNGSIDFNNDDVVAAFAKAQAFLKDHSKNILNGAPTDWDDPTSFSSGLANMQWTGLWALPAISAALGDDFGVVPWPAIGSGTGTPATFWGGWSEFVNAKSKHLDEAKAYVKWLWIDNTDIQKDWALSYGFHVPPRKSVAAAAAQLQSGPAKDAVDALTKYGVPSDPAWTSAMETMWTDSITNILRNGADPRTELANLAPKIQAQLGNQG